MGFDQINYKGKPVVRDGFMAQNFRAIPYAHQYLVKGLQLFPGDPEPEKRHACLLMGDWCWQDVREHPLDMIAYLKLKIRKH